MWDEEEMEDQLDGLCDFVDLSSTESCFRPDNFPDRTNLVTSGLSSPASTSSLDSSPCKEPCCLCDQAPLSPLVQLDGNGDLPPFMPPLNPNATPFVQENVQNVQQNDTQSELLIAGKVAVVDNEEGSTQASIPCLDFAADESTHSSVLFNCNKDFNNYLCNRSLTCTPQTSPQTPLTLSQVAATKVRNTSP